MIRKGILELNLKMEFMIIHLKIFVFNTITPEKIEILYTLIIPG